MTLQLQFASALRRSVLAADVHGIGLVLFLCALTFQGCTGASSGSSGSLHDGTKAADAIANGSVTCSSDTDCAAHQPVCDPLNAVCVECLFDTQCGESARCVDKQCLPVALCGNASDCADSTDAPVCDPLTGTCVACIADDSCEDLAHCEDNQCVPYTPCSSSLECDDDQVCDTKMGECVFCLENTDCGENEQCVDQSCSPYTPCTSSIDCLDSPHGPICYAQIGECVLCVTDPDCAPEERCVDLECVPYISCTSDKECTVFGMLCDKDAAECKQCLEQIHCPPGYFCASGKCSADICTPDGARCEGNAVLHCNEDGDGFGTSEPCAAGESCVETGMSAACTSWVCEPGMKYCEEGVVFSCAADGVSFSSGEICAATGLVCASGICVEPLCTPGALSCEGAVVAQCNDDAMSLEITPCADDTTCDGGVCRQKICPPGAYACQQNTVLKCNDLATNLGMVTECEGDQTCSCGGDPYLCECADHICVPGAMTCSPDDSAVDTCADNGLSVLTELCVPGQATCDQGECKAILCEINATFCDGYKVKQCNTKGTGAIQLAACDPDNQICVDGACVQDICNPGTSLCNGSFEVKTCNPSGVGYFTDPCPPNESCKDGGCYPQICAPNTTLCAGMVLKLCDGLGFETSALVDCTAQDQGCLDGACVDKICEPGVLYCNENISTQCTSFGLMGETEKDCTATSTYCHEGFCNPCPAPNFAGENCDKCAVNYAGDNCDQCAAGYEGEDCKDCLALSLVELPGDGLDNDCDGTTDLLLCDCTELTGTSLAALACAAELACKSDLISKKTITSPTGDDLSGSYKAVTHFGTINNDISPKKGGSYTLLSTGYAQSSDRSRPLPGGWELTDPYSPSEKMNDASEFRVSLTAPMNAQGFAIDYVFFSAEYDEWVGDSYNDRFYIILNGPQTTGGENKVVNFTDCRKPSSYFDLTGDDCDLASNYCCYIAVNTSLSECCWYQGCLDGIWSTNIAGTGFSCAGSQSGDNSSTGSSTGWLTTTWPIEPGETFDLTFHIHDTADQLYDSEVALDNFRWFWVPVEGGTSTTSVSIPECPDGSDCNP